MTGFLEVNLKDGATALLIASESMTDGTLLGVALQPTGAIIVADISPAGPYDPALGQWCALPADLFGEDVRAVVELGNPNFADGNLAELERQMAAVCGNPASPDLVLRALKAT